MFSMTFGCGLDDLTSKLLLTVKTNDIAIGARTFFHTGGWDLNGLVRAKGTNELLDSGKMLCVYGSDRHYAHVSLS